MLFLKICSSILIPQKLPLPDKGKQNDPTIEYTVYAVCEKIRAARIRSLPYQNRQLKGLNRLITVFRIRWLRLSEPLNPIGHCIDIHSGTNRSEHNIIPCEKLMCFHIVFHDQIEQSRQSSHR